MNEIKKLLTRQNVNKKDQNGNTALMYSVYFRNMNWNSVQIVRMILEPLKNIQFNLIFTPKQ